MKLRFDLLLPPPEGPGTTGKPGAPINLGARYLRTHGDTMGKMGTSDASPHSSPVLPGKTGWLGSVAVNDSWASPLSPPAPPGFATASCRACDREEFIAERAAIMEFDGGLSREEAEAKALLAEGGRDPC